MSGVGTLHHAVHTARIDAAAGTVYRLVADVTCWPVMFGPTVHVQVTEHDELGERFRIWATINGAVASWTSRREFDPGSSCVRFQQERSAAPVASMGGEWRIRPLDAGRCEVELHHHFSVVDDDPAALASITRALDDNSAAELGALRRMAEVEHSAGSIVLEFEDRATSHGSAADIMEFLRRGDLWAERLPHVRTAEMSETADGVQQLTMETETADGSTHRTSSTRLVLDGTLVYKQQVLPRLLFGHAGRWTVGPGRTGGTILTARHLVAIDPAAIDEALGAGRTLEDARRFVRAALGGNSMRTMESACAYAEGTLP